MSELRSRTAGSSPSSDPRQDDPERQWDECAHCLCYRANHITLESGRVECITVFDEGTDNEHECECDGFRVTGPGSSPSNVPDQESTMTEVFDMGDGPDGTPAFDVCADCGHYRGEHDGTVCHCVILSATRPSRQCDCDGFLDA